MGACKARYLWHIIFIAAAKLLDKRSLLGKGYQVTQERLGGSKLDNAKTGLAPLQMQDVLQVI